MCTSFPICGPIIPPMRRQGGVPAISEVKFSLISNRGCFGGCSFCALTFHQGRIIQARSHESLLEEAKAFDQRIRTLRAISMMWAAPRPISGTRPVEKQMDEGSLPEPAVPVSRSPAKI